MLSSADTIAAIATPPGTGGVAVIRVSGPKSSLFLQTLFRPGKIGSKSGRSADRPFSFRPRHMHYGWILDRDGQVLDEVLAVHMPGPASATGEDVAEVHCHGGQAIAAGVLEAFLTAGARLAAPGEFTKRAYLNGRIDLTQAEAVIEAVNAPSREGIRLAEAKLGGALSAKISVLRSSLDSLRIQMTVAVDFPDDEPEIMPHGAVATLIRNARDEACALVAAFERASLWREGAVAVLAGQVNAGKSSLLNALLGRDRAIVSSVPGTTRDYIEETVNIEGMAVRLVDTAGLRQGGDIVEEEGIRRSHTLADSADLLLLVLDAERLAANDGRLEHVEREFLERHEQKGKEGRLLLVLNKSDAAGRPSISSLPFFCPSFSVSAAEGTGLDHLSSGIFKALSASSVVPAGDIAPNRRQAALLSEAITELSLLEDDLEAALPPDILAVRVDHAVMLLDEVTGTTPDEAILDTIFSSFCIGK